MKKTKIKLSRLTAAVIIVLTIIVLVQIYDAEQKIAVAKTQQAELTSQLKLLQSANTALGAQIESADDPKTKENIARSRLGLILPGEIIYKEY